MKLDKTTASFVDLLFDEDMFKSAMKTMKLDPQKLPLGALTKRQVDLGYEKLEAIQELVDKKTSASSNEWATRTAAFYNAIPHAFG